jgi:serine/threonine-protein kinase
MSSATREQKRLLYEQMIGTVIADKFQITGLLGFGGMGAVYEAVQSPMDRKVALKLIPTYDPTAAARFEREAYTVSKLTHPNTVTVFDFGHTSDGHLYLSMEHLIGHTLTDLIRSVGPISGARAVHIAQQICRSLGEAHRQGIIHRDVKPDNIFLINVDGDPDYVKVLDFGIAKAVHGEEDVSLTAEGRIIGTPRYMSPEQILAQPVDHRSDIYSLGCILFEMVCGSPPFDQQSTAALMMSHAQQAPPSFADRLTPSQLNAIPPGLESLVRRTMAKNPTARPQTTDELRDELDRALRINRAYEGGTHETNQVRPVHPTGQRPPLSTGNHTGPRPMQTGDVANQTGGFDHHTGDFSRQTGDFHARQPGEPTNMDIAAELAQMRGSQNRMIAGGVLLLLLAIIGVGGYVFLNGNKNEEKSDPVEEKAPVVEKQTTPVSDKPLTKTMLVSSPKGAKIYVGEGDAKKEVGETPFMLEVQPDDAIRTYRIELDGYESDAVTINPKALKEDYTVALEKRSEEDKKSDRGNKRRNSSKRNNRKNSGEDEKETTPAKVEETTPPAEKDPKTVDPPKETTPKSPVIDRLDDEEDKPNVERID